jgi:hypothetical protein
MLPNFLKMVFTSTHGFCTLCFFYRWQLTNYQLHIFLGEQKGSKKYYNNPINIFHEFELMKLNTP